MTEKQTELPGVRGRDRGKEKEREREREREERKINIITINNYSIR